MKLHALAPLSLALLVLSADTPRADEGLACRPVEGVTYASRFERRIALALDEDLEYALVVDGVELEWWPFPIFTALEERLELELRDRWAAVAEGAPRAMVREHERLARSVVHRLGRHVADSGPGRCALEGLRVRFEGAADGGPLAAVAVEPDRRRARELLAGLRARADLAGFLPPGEVEPGDAWEVPAAAVFAALEPAGVLPFEHEGDALPFDPLEGRLLAELAGALDAEWRGTEVLDGRRIARVALDGALSIESSRDASGRVLRAGDDERVDGFEQLERRLTATCEGELEWDLAAGRARALRLDAELELDLHLEGRSSDATTTTRLVGTWRGRLELRARCDEE